MSIYVNEEKKEFHLYNNDISYIIHVLPNGHIGHLYFGKRVSTEKSYNYLCQGIHRPLTAYVYEDDEIFSLQHTKQEYPCFGTGDFLVPAFSIKQEDGSFLSDFKYVSYVIQKGKPHLTGLPSIYVENENEAVTLQIILKDTVTETKLVLSYTILENYSAITRQALFIQEGDSVVELEKALSFSLDLSDSQYELVHLAGAWGRERHVEKRVLTPGNQSIYSLKGASSSEHNPFIALKRFETTEFNGEVIGCSFIYSGNFLASVDVTPYEAARVSMGIHPHGFSWRLKKGDSFQTPEAVIVYSEKGMNGMSQTFHELYRKRLVRGEWRDKNRPVLLNNWEAMTFDFDEERILALATQASKVGVELFVLDDGWFGKRNNDLAGLGDWFVNLDKLPNGLSYIIDKTHELGMKFGLWIEPEMVNKDSDLYRQHPDWILHHPKRSSSPSRHQYTLDFSREDVFENIYQQISHLLRTHAIDYIKWDMNRYITECYSVYYHANQQGEIFHRYILNVYRLYDKLTCEFPHVLFESCSSGGGRFDPGMLYYAPQTWTSDNTDAIERLYIQYGTSYVYPLMSMGCHVSESPNQQVNRTTSLSTRANVAYFGSFGYELDLSTCSKEELEHISEQIIYYKANREVFQKGTFTRLLNPHEDNATAWQVISEDKKTVIVGYYNHLIHANAGFKRIYLKDLCATQAYRMNEEIYYGSELMSVGIRVSTQGKDFSSYIYHFEVVTE